MNLKATAALAALTLLLPPLAAPAAAQAVIEGDGAAALGVALRRLDTTKRVLMIAAHPDDENTALLAELALGDGADVAYLSLTRGEGGQNLIGPELQEGLGLIRTEELLAARRLDGARQFFTRAYDYGFSKSADEAFTQWPRDSLLADVVEVVRRYRPDVIISVFSGTPADGHGQHQAAGIMARAAFAAAADPVQYPQHAARGLAPHSATYLFQALYRPPADPPLRVSVGELDPLFGRSRYQIAMQSRSRHRSQDMGRSEPLGPQHVALTLLDARAGSVNAAGGARPTLFAGIDTTLMQHALSAGAPTGILTHLTEYANAVAEARATYNPLVRGGLRGVLIEALRALNAAHALLPDEPGLHALRRQIGNERQQVADALRLDAGVVIDVLADTPTPVPGTSFGLTVTIWNGGRTPVGLASLRPVLPRGWTMDGDTSAGLDIEPNGVVRRAIRVHVPRDAARTEPYFLRTPRTGANYAWTAAADSVRALPFEPSAIGVDAELVIGGRVVVSRAAEYATVDKAIGELRRPLLVVPAASVAVEPEVATIASNDVAPRTISVSVRSAVDSLQGSVALRVPAGWRVEPASHDVAIVAAGHSQAVQFTVTAPASVTGQHELHALLRVDDHVYTDGYTLIDYPHIQPHALYRPATVRVSAFPVTIADNLRVGYIEGAGDDGAEALTQLGAAVDLLDAAALGSADLSQYDAIVAGIRAYEVRPDLVTHNDRLLRYTRDGGVFIVQYNKYELVQGGFMPFAATMAQPHGRVTDETAAVELLEPTHPLLSFPNRITATDFDGWVQERGLYFLDTWDERYMPLLSMSDPGEAAQRGSIVAARVDEGWYVYTGLALFRQLPEGVPGAFRLLANLVSLAKSSATR